MQTVNVYQIHIETINQIKRDMIFFVIKNKKKKMDKMFIKKKIK